MTAKRALLSAYDKTGIVDLARGLVELGWELVSSVPLIAPNRDGIAYGTVGCQMILKRSKQTQ